MQPVRHFNGFEPDRSCLDKHVSYRDIEQVLTQVTEHSVVTVFHHFRRVSFPEDFSRIRARLGGVYPCTAIYWQSLMFVAIGRSESCVAAVAGANRQYAGRNPVRVIE